MTTLNVNPFNLQTGVNIIGPATAPQAVTRLALDIDFADVVAVQPLNPPIWVELQTSVDAGQTWRMELRFDVDSVGPSQRLSPTVSCNIPAGARVRVSIDTPVALHSDGGTFSFD